MNSTVTRNSLSDHKLISMLKCITWSKCMPVPDKQTNIMAIARRYILMNASCAKNHELVTEKDMNTSAIVQHSPTMRHHCQCHFRHCGHMTKNCHHLNPSSDYSAHWKTQSRIQIQSNYAYQLKEMYSLAVKVPQCSLNGKFSNTFYHKQKHRRYREQIHWKHTRSHSYPIT